MFEMGVALKPLKIKKCAECKQEFQPKSSSARVCGLFCAIEYAKKNGSKRKSGSLPREESVSEHVRNG